VNTEELPGLAQRLRINAIPLTAVFKGGRELARQAGAMPASAIFGNLSNRPVKQRPDKTFLVWSRLGSAASRECCTPESYLAFIP